MTTRIALALAALLAAVPPVAAAEKARLDLFHGPDSTGAMTLKSLRMTLDGKDLGVPLPAADGADKALFSEGVDPGLHRLEVEASLENGKSVFSYMDGYRVKLRSVLDLEVLAGKGISVRSRIVPKGGITTQWSEQNKLVLTLSQADAADIPPAVASAGPAAPAAPAAAEAPAAPAPEPAPPAAQGPSGDADAPAAPAAREAPAPPAEAARVARVAAAGPAPAAAEAPAAAPPPRPAPEPAGDCRTSPIRFGFDRATLPDEARAELDRFASCVAATRVAIRVEGHSDSRGGDEYNVWLGWDRAASVSAYLRERGVADRRITTRSRGAATPLCPEATDECFARNRRVEVTVAE